MRLVLLLVPLALIGCKSRAPRLEQECTFNQECMLTMVGADCCDGCDVLIGTVASVSERRGFCQEKPAKSCPKLDCVSSSKTAFCINGRCTMRDGLH
jgi:hypothetical protein